MPNGDAEDKTLTLDPMYIWFAAVAVIALIAAMASQSTGWTAAVGIIVIIFVASFAAGAGIGFLFGVPRVLTRGDGISTNSMPSTNSESQESTQQRLLRSNTNLERISDWLTTLLVGVGLSQLHNINHGLVGFRNFIADQAQVFGEGTARTAGVLPAVAPPVLIFGAVVGFLLMYLYTRTSLVRLLDAVERDLLTGGASKATRRTAEQIAEQTGSFVASQVSKSRDVSVDDALSVMFNALYRPAGYRQVIELAGKLLHTKTAERAEFWFYLAAAFGQQLADRDPGDEDARNSDRANALDAARRAVQIDPVFKNRLAYIADPEGADRDLAPLYSDPDFQRIIG